MGIYPALQIQPPDVIDPMLKAAQTQQVNQQTQNLGLTNQQQQIQLGLLKQYLGSVNGSQGASGSLSTISGALGGSGNGSAPGNPALLAMINPEAARAIADVNQKNVVTQQDRAALAATRNAQALTGVNNQDDWQAALTQQYQQGDISPLAYQRYVSTPYSPELKASLLSNFQGMDTAFLNIGYNIKDGTKLVQQPDGSYVKMPIPGSIQTQAAQAGATAGAQAQATLPYDITKANAAPANLGPGETRFVNGQPTMQTGQWIDSVAQTGEKDANGNPIQPGTPVRRFVAPPVTMAGGIPAAGGAGAPVAPGVQPSAVGSAPGSLPPVPQPLLDQLNAPAGARGAPAAAPTASTAPIPTGNPPGQVEALTKYREQLLGEAKAANEANNTIDNMRIDSQTWLPGKFADVKGDASAYLDSIAKNLGVATPQLDSSVGDWQAFNKSAGSLVRDATRAVSSHEAFAGMQMISKSLPSDTTTPAGLETVFDQLQGLNDFKQAKSAAAANWNGSPNAFESDFNNHVSPMAFTVARMTPQSYATLASNLKQTAQGRDVLQKIVSQMQYAQNNGMFSKAQ